MRCPGTMRFNAALRAAHHGRGFGNVHILPVTQQECLALTPRQGFQCLFNNSNNLSLFKLFKWPIRRPGRIPGTQSFQGVALLVIIAVRKRGKQGSPQRPHLLPAVVVTDVILQDTLKQQGQLRKRFCRVFLGKLEHRVLNDIQRRIFIPHREQRLLIRAAFRSGQKIGEFLIGSQLSQPRGLK